MRQEMTGFWDAVAVVCASTLLAGRQEEHPACKN